MLRLVLKKEEQLMIGDNIVIKSMNDGRISLAIDAPKDIKIERMKRENEVKVSLESRDISCDILE